MTSDVTDEMIEAGRKAGRISIMGYELEAIYLAMHAARPLPDDVERRRLETCARDNFDKAMAALEQVVKLREALEFYADPDGDGYDIQVTNYGLSTEDGHIIKDGGEIARSALNQSGGEA